MGRPDGGRRDPPGTSAVSLVFGGTAFLQQPFASPSFGWRLGSGADGSGSGGGGGTRGEGARSLARRVLAWRRGPGTVTCIACGRTVERSDAREYDKHGDRFDRRDKRFEHLCKRCHRDIDHKPRRELESLLVEFDGDDGTRDEFLAWYCGRVEERYGPLEED